MRSRDGTSTQQAEQVLARLDQLKKRTGLQVPEIERTVLKLTKEPKDKSLWARLTQRVLGYLVGIVEVSSSSHFVSFKH